MTVDANEVYQANLDAVASALMAGDLPLAMDHVGLPNMLATSDAEIVIASAEMLDLVMSDFRSHLRNKGVAEYRRICTEAAFVPGMSDMIAGRDETRMTQADGTQLPVCSNRMVLFRFDTGWKAIWTQTDVTNHELQILSPDIAAAQAEAHRLLETTGTATAPATSDPERRDPK